MSQSLATNGYKRFQDRIPLSGCVVDLEQERVLRGEGVLPLTTREARLLRYLWQREGEDVSRRELLVEVWGYSVRARSRAVDATVQRLRTKIEHDPAAPDHLRTVWGSGYRLVAAEPDAPRGEGPPLYGRDAELRAVREAFAEGRPLVTLVGPSGVGKTRLAREVMVALEHRFCALETATDETGLVGGITAALGADLASKDLLARSELVVLDNLEQAIEPAARVVSRLLRAAPRIQILATSREALGLEAEHVVELGPLSVDASVTLLEARGVQWGASRESLQALAVRLEGMPLALELAAGLAPVLSPEALLSRLDARMNVLVSRRRDVPARHQSLRHAIAWSFELLDASDAKALVDLSVFCGGFTADGAEGVLGPDAVSTLGRLRARSLVRPLPGREPRLGLYEAVRLHALERLAASSSDARERHRAWYAGEVRRRFDPAGPFPDPADVVFVAEEIDNVTAAFHGSIAEHSDDAVAMALAASHVFMRRGPAGRALELLDACLALTLPDSTRGHVLRARGNTELLLGRTTEAAADARAAIALGVRDPLLQGRASSLLGMVLQHSGEFDAAVATYEQAIALTQRACDRAYEASATGNYGTALWSADRFEDSGRAYARSVELHRELGNARSAAIMLGNLGLHDLDEGRLERSRFRLGQALSEQRRLDDRVAEGVTLGHLACHAHIAGDLRAARERAEEGVRILASVGERDCRAHEVLLLGTIAWELGDRARAHEQVERAREDLGSRPESAGALFLLELVLRLDEGELVEGVTFPGCAGSVRTRALQRLAEGFLLAADPQRRAEVPEVLAEIPKRRLVTTVTPWRRALARRVTAR